MTEQVGHTLEQRIEALIEEVIAETPVYLIEVEIRGRKGSHALDVYLDSDDELTIEEIARVNRRLNALMEEREMLPDGYTLHVSSPGLNRPLGPPRQFRKNVGRDLSVQLNQEGDERPTKVTGKLISADDEAIDLEIGKETKRIPYEDIASAKVQLPW
jgi:ribosome maturation factor RimP